MKNISGKKFLFSLFSLLIFFFFIFQNEVYAADENNKLPVITIVNPIRGNELGHEKDDLLSGLKIQWKYTRDATVSATWLWQYSALENEKLVNFAKENMTGQEFGVFLEIDRNFANKSKVQYRGQGPWYFSDGLFLVSYDKEERKKLIDEVFTKFKATFGYLPKTVGSWWIGGDSLVYMQEKYGITAALKASDQFDLDVYSIWGTPWSIPYLASRENEGIPADSFDKSSKVVILQWAARDPTKGYADFAFSVQDFTLRESDFSYVNYLSSVFLQNPLNNMVLGLENSGSAAPLEVYYEKIVKKARELEDSRKIKISLAKDYAQEFLAQKRIFSNNDSDVKFFLTKDYKSEDQSFWYHSANLRAGIIKSGENIYLIDLRDYGYKAHEDFSLLPNSQGYLRVSTPAIIDSMRFPERKILITKSNETMNVEEKNDEVTLFTGNKKIAYFTKSSLQLFADSNNSKTFKVTNRAFTVNIFYILSVTFLLYFIIILVHKKDLLRSLVQFFLLLIPLVIAYPFLSGGELNHLNFVFDRKELFLFYFFPILKNISISYNLLLFQIVPFIVLLITHYIFTILLPGKICKIIFYIFLGIITVLYSHTMYFPLDRSTYVITFSVFAALACILIAFSILFFMVTKSKKLLVTFFVIIPIILVLLGGVVYSSRAKLVLTPFEVDALEIIKERHKDVIFVSETDYNIKPIYKAVKPILYENYHLGEKLTNTQWQIVVRPENNILRLSNYDDKIVMVPRYLGADLSAKEMQLLKLKKIFDNAQIAIFEKK